MKTVFLSCPVMSGQSASKLIVNLGILMKLIEHKTSAARSIKSIIWEHCTHVRHHISKASINYNWPGRQNICEDFNDKQVKEAQMFTFEKT